MDNGNKCIVCNTPNVQSHPQGAAAVLSYTIARVVALSC